MASNRGVQSTLGLVLAEELGVTMPHEHVFFDSSVYVDWEPPPNSDVLPLADHPVGRHDAGWLLENLAVLRANPFLNRDNLRHQRDSDFEVACAEVGEFAARGGRTLVDLTLPGAGRDPVALREVAQRMGVNIVAGCGYYIYISHPPGLANRSIDDLAEELIKELTEGIGETGIRAGIIGELGTSHPLHPDEEKVLRAGARAQRETGASISLHLYPCVEAGHHLLDILEAEGADLTRVAVGHLDNDLGQPGVDRRKILAYHRALADRGAFVQYDCCGNEVFYASSRYQDAFWMPCDRERLEAILSLFESGHESRLLLSHDVCKKTHMKSYGGVGYAHILRQFVPQLESLGLVERQIRQLLVENPRRLLCGA